MKLTALPIEALAAAGLSLLAGVAFALHARAIGWQVVDDAAISAAYIQTFVEGFGFRATPSSQPVEAFSNPAWTMWLGLAFLLRVSVIAFSAYTGVAFAAAGVAALGLWGATASARLPRIEDAAAPWLVASFPSLAGWSSTGLEIGLYVFLFSLGGLLTLRTLHSGRGIAAGVVWGLLCLTRPEAPLFVVLVGLVWLVDRFARQRRPTRQELLLVAVFLGVMLAWLVFRWSYFAAILPNTFYAKQTWDFAVGNYFHGFFVQYRWSWIAGLVGTVFAFLGGAATRRAALLGSGFVACEALFTWHAKGDWMGEWRFLVPVMPAVAAAASAGLSAMR
ncbi:MAG TPA: hypothetical protein VE782_16930, partial [Myxococcaceae bacterium]|nr:hypothetical protein [Myxococcaceae bacterium]